METTPQRMHVETNCLNCDGELQAVVIEKTFAWVHTALGPFIGPCEEPKPNECESCDEQYALPGAHQCRDCIEEDPGYDPYFEYA